VQLKEVRRLSPGDTVYWNDPDDGCCSKFITIRSIKVLEDEMVFIHGADRSDLECYAEELSAEQGEK